MQIPGAEKAIVNLVKWSVKKEWLPYWEQVLAEHFDMILDRFNTTTEEIAELLGDAFGMVYSTALEDFFTARFGDQGDQNVIDDYLKRRGWRETVPAKRYLVALRDSVLSLYEVVDLDPGHTMTVRDLVRGGNPITLEEKLGSESAARWDRIAGRIVTVNKKVYFTGAILLFPREVADEVLSDIEKRIKSFGNKLRREAKKLGEPADIRDGDPREMILYSSVRLFTQIWLIGALNRASEPLPEIRNDDGDEIMFSEARFPITGEVTEVIAGLDDIDDFEKDDPNELRWSWLGHSSPSRRASRGQGLALETNDNAGQIILGNLEIAYNALVLSTNSKERAEKGRNLLLSRLDGLVGRPLISHRTLEKMLDEDPDPARSELPPEEAEQAIHSFLDNHYRRALDDPLPYLNGKTPRQAVKAGKSRAQVINWLKQLENSESRRAAKQRQAPYDFHWMWRELGIDDPG